MDLHHLTRELHVKNNTKIVMYVADGLGGLPQEPGGLTELETANTPNLDALAKRGVLRRQHSRCCPASAPAAARATSACSATTRCNTSSAAARSRPPASASSCRRATSPSAPTSARSTPAATSPIAAPAAFPREESAPLAHQAARGEDSRRRSVRRAGEGASLRRRPPRRRACTATCTTPIRSAPASRRSTPSPPTRDSEKTAEVASEFVRQARKLLAGEPKANGLTLRGFSGKPKLPSYEEVYGLRAAAIAVYPMYKGLARLVGMDIVGNAANARRADDAARSRTGRSTTSSSSTSSTPTAPAKTATSPPR